MPKSTGYPSVVGHTDWGAPSPITVRWFGPNWITAALFIYGSASKPLLKQLDPIHHQGFRTALGAFRTSPVQSLYVEAHELSLSSRRLKLSLNYVTKLNSCPTNPAYSAVFEPQNAKLFAERPQFVTPPLGLRMLPQLQSLGLDLDVIDDNSFLDTVPRTLCTNRSFRSYPV